MLSHQPRFFARLSNRESRFFHMFNVCYIPRWIKWILWTSGFAMRNLHSVTTRLASIYERTTRIRMSGSTCFPRIARWWVTQGHALFYAFRALHTCALLSTNLKTRKKFLSKKINSREILELWIFYLNRFLQGVLMQKESSREILEFILNRWRLFNLRSGKLIY